MRWRVIGTRAEGPPWVGVLESDQMREKWSGLGAGSVGCSVWKLRRGEGVGSGSRGRNPLASKRPA